MSRFKNRGLSGRILSALKQHGPMTSYGLAEVLGASPQAVDNGCGHLVRREEIIYAEGARRPIGQLGRACHTWKINPGPPSSDIAPPNTMRRVDWNNGITPEDMAWMQHYRERRAQRIAQSGGRGHAAHADGSR